MTLSRVASIPQAVRAALQDLSRRIGPTSWVYPSLSGTWVNYGGAYTPARFRREGAHVEIQGVVRNGSVSGESVVFTLPPEFRPRRHLIFPAITDPNVFCRLNVRSTGWVSVQGAAPGWVSLNCVFGIGD